MKLYEIAGMFQDKCYDHLPKHKNKWPKRTRDRYFTELGFLYDFLTTMEPELEKFYAKPPVTLEQAKEQTRNALKGRE